MIFHSRNRTRRMPPQEPMASSIVFHFDQSFENYNSKNKIFIIKRRYPNNHAYIYWALVEAQK